MAVNTVESMEHTTEQQTSVSPRGFFVNLLMKIVKPRAEVGQVELTEQQEAKAMLAKIESRVKEGAKWQDLSLDERMFLWDQYMGLYPTRFQSFYDEHLQIMQKMVQTADGAGPKDIADLGCGTGTAIEAILSAVTTNGSWPQVLHARDISNVSLTQYREATDKAVKSIGRKTPQITQLDRDIQRCDLETAALNRILPQDGEGDFVSLGWILPYLTENGIQRTLQAVTGYLKEGGVVFVNVHVEGYSIKRMLFRDNLSGLRETIPLLTNGTMKLPEVLGSKKVVNLFEKLSSGLPTAKEWEEKFKQAGLSVKEHLPIFHDKGEPLGVIYLLQKND